ncbi:MAG: hypothetical protein ABFD50_16855 [Smithella sp.]
MKKLLFILLLAPLFGLSQKPVTMPLYTVKNGELVIDKIDSTDARRDTLFYLVDFDRKPRFINLFKLWESYVIECNELVADTVRETGLSNTKDVPVRLNGKIVSYNRIPKDTVWSKGMCKEYKIRTDPYWSFQVDTTTVLKDGWHHSYDYPIYRYSNVVRFNKETVDYIEVHRNKICHIKSRKATWDDFWERWLVEKKVIEMN